MTIGVDPAIALHLQQHALAAEGAAQQVYQAAHGEVRQATGGPGLG